MSRKLVLGLALAVVLFGGSVISAQADCGCLPHISLPSCLSCSKAVEQPVRDRDCAGNLITPDVMGAPGAY